MADSLHPHWQTTETEEVPVRASARPAAAPTPAGPRHVRIGAGSVSRRPAAFVGIALVLGLGITAYTAQHAGEPGGTPLTAQTAATYTDVLRELAENNEPWNAGQGANMSPPPAAPRPSPVPAGNLSTAIPQNPNVAGEPGSQPLPENTATVAGDAASVLHSGAPPFKQPETGGWTLAWAAGASAAGLATVYRKTLRRV